MFAEVAKRSAQARQEREKVREEILRENERNVYHRKTFAAPAGAANSSQAAAAGSSSASSSSSSAMDVDAGNGASSNSTVSASSSLPSSLSKTSSNADHAPSGRASFSADDATMTDASSLSLTASSSSSKASSSSAGDSKDSTAAVEAKDDRMTDEREVSPDALVEPARLSVACYRDPVLLCGNYLKFDRELSQTEWVLEGMVLARETALAELCCA